jgi:4-amino-4-deoxy-L-arabinose transferase-like glycosyltransferase
VVHLPGRHRAPGGIAEVADEARAFPWPLFVVLAGQTFLSLRLVWSNTAFVDEATYIWAGRIELSHLVSGTPVQPYATYFSGAPVIYPLLAGLADIAGGLATVRVLSLVFMLGATCMLWGSARSLFGQRAAVCAVALFAAIGSTQFLGALATFDAMALFLVTLAARLVVAAKDRADSTPLIIGVIAALTLANATKYASGLYDPVVIGLAVLTSPHGVKAGLGRGGLIFVSTAGLIAGLLTIGGSWYVAGVEWTTLSRSAGEQSPVLVLADAARWIGVVLILAVAAVAVAWWRDRNLLPLVIWLTAAGILAPANQARIHTTVSLSKHVDFGAWFACMAAGYAIAAITRAGRRRQLHVGIALAAAAVIMLPAGALGRSQAAGFTKGWPDSTQLTAELRALSRAHPGTYLTEDYVVPGFYLQDELTWQAWQSTWYFHYRAPEQNACIGGSAATAIGSSRSAAQAASAFSQAVAHQYFALIILNFADTPQLDQEITRVIKQSATYHVIAILPYKAPGIAGQYTVWAPTAERKGEAHGSIC